MNTETVPSAKLKWAVFITLVIIGSTIFTHNLKYTIPAACAGLALDIYLFVFYPRAKSRRNMIIAAALVAVFGVVLYFVVNALVPIK